MANWPVNPTWTDPTQINNGQEYIPADGLLASDLNKIVENALYIFMSKGLGGNRTLFISTALTIPTPKEGYYHISKKHIAYAEEVQVNDVILRAGVLFLVTNIQPNLDTFKCTLLKDLTGPPGSSAGFYFTSQSNTVKMVSNCPYTTMPGASKDTVHVDDYVLDINGNLFKIPEWNPINTSQPGIREDGVSLVHVKNLVAPPKGSLMPQYAYGNTTEDSPAVKYPITTWVKLTQFDNKVLRGGSTPGVEGGSDNAVLIKHNHGTQSVISDGNVSGGTIRQDTIAIPSGQTYLSFDMNSEAGSTTVYKAYTKDGDIGQGLVVTAYKGRLNDGTWLDYDTEVDESGVGKNVPAYITFTMWRRTD